MSRSGARILLVPGALLAYVALVLLVLWVQPPARDFLFALELALLGSLLVVAVASLTVHRGILSGRLASGQLLHSSSGEPVGGGAVPAGIEDASGLGAAPAQRPARLRAELDALELEKLRLHALLEALRDGIFCLNRDGSIAYRNRALAPSLVSERYAGRPYYKCIRSAELLEYVHRVLQRAAAAERAPGQATREPLPQNSESFGTHTFRAGDSFFAVTHYPVSIAGQPELQLFVVQDRSEQARVQLLREEFLANAEHELKTPITSIRGYVETLLPKADREPLKGFLEAILRNSLRMERLLEDMATISSVESGEYAFAPESIDVADFLESAGRLARGVLAARAQQLQLESTPGLSIQSDPLLLEHLLLNLIANASRYSPEGSRIYVSIARDSEDRFRIRVADEGPGVPAEFRSKIFERFFRIDHDRSRKDGGTGLGLSIVRQIARLHGGRVWVEDAPQGGALFQVILMDAREHRRSRITG